jgi:hypothetical protein
MIHIVLTLVAFAACPLTAGEAKAEPQKKVLQHEASGTQALGKEGRKDKGLEEKIELLPHQRVPVEYLYEHKEIKGLLVNHQMGTGKTYLAIGFAEKYPDRPVVVIAPGFIEGHWREHMKRFGVKNGERYEFLSYRDAPAKLLTRDLSKTILILDEVHNYVKNLKSSNPEHGKRFSELYLHLRSSHKILALSGTPLYSDEYDLAYIFNLVAGKNVVPFNEEEFRLAYSEILPWRSYGRGHLTESIALGFATGTVIPFAFTALFAQPLFLLSGPIFLALIPFINYTVYPLSKFHLRRLASERFASIMSKYVSFYEVENQDMSEFPTSTMKVQTVPYNDPQFKTFLKFAEGDLDNESLKLLLGEYDGSLSNAYIEVNSTLLQNSLRGVVGGGREIGNLAYFDAKAKRLVESPKFEKIFDAMKAAGMPKTVVYSSFFETGILPFVNFLKRKGYVGKVAVLNPDAPVDEMYRTIAAYNNDEIQLLALHPEITEGITLKGTRQLQILEPVINSTLLNQIIARTARYKSHSHLPKEQRYVDVFMWKAVIDEVDFKTIRQRKNNWRKRYAEFNDWSGWGPGIQQVDPNYYRKYYSPDEYAFLKLSTLTENIEGFKNAARKHSIEKRS